MEGRWAPAIKGLLAEVIVFMVGRVVLKVPSIFPLTLIASTKTYK